jgi:hypothetical protein
MTDDAVMAHCGVHEQVVLPADMLEPASGRAVVALDLTEHIAGEEARLKASHRRPSGSTQERRSTRWRHTVSGIAPRRWLDLGVYVCVCVVEGWGQRSFVSPLPP